MFIQPDLCWPSKMPFPSKENEPAVPAVIEAWNSNRDDLRLRRRAWQPAPPGRARAHRRRRNRPAPTAQRARAEQGEDAARGSSATLRSSRGLRACYPSNGARSARQRLGVLAERRGALPVSTGSPSHSDCLCEGRDGADHHVLALEELEPARDSGRDSKDLPRAPRPALPGPARSDALDELGPLDQLAEPLPELRLDRRHREEAAVGRLVRCGSTRARR